MEEARSGAKSSQPYYFSLREGKAFVFAGLWENWQPKDDPESKLITCTIITTVANALVAKVRPNAGHPKRGGQVGLAARGQPCSVESPP